MLVEDRRSCVTEVGDRCDPNWARSREAVCRLGGVSGNGEPWTSAGRSMLRSMDERRRGAEGKRVVRRSEKERRRRDC